MIKSLFLIYLAVASALLAGARGVGATPSADDREWRFRVLLDGDEIGFHTFRVRRTSDAQTVESAATFKVKVLFLTAYAYDHRAAERWLGNCLQSVNAETDDNGTLYRIEGSLQDGGFVLDNGRQPRELPSCVMSFAYWNPAILEQTRLLNVQTGDYVTVAVRSQGEETLQRGDTPVSANRYVLLAEDREIALWYDSDDLTWLGLESLTKEGRTLRYELQTISHPVGQDPVNG